MKISDYKKEQICELYSQGKGIVEISKITQTYSNNVRKIIVEKFGVLPKKCKLTIDDLQERISKIFPHLKVLTYIDVNKKVNFLCTKHNLEFELYPKSVLGGADCPQCRLDKKKSKPIKEKSQSRIYHSTTFEEFKDKAIAKFGNKFQYLNYVGYKNKFQVICPIHGLQNQTPVAHLTYVHGCGKCATENKVLTHSEFLQRANQTHGSKFVYLNEYLGGDTIMNIKCENHGVFKLKARVHLNNKIGCPKCSAYTSKQETYIKEFLSDFDLNLEQHNRKLLKGCEIDILVNDKIGFEINGLLFHREGLLAYKINPTNNDKNRHLLKTELSRQNGIKLYHIFEDEILNKPEIVKNKILNACGINVGKKCNARDCIITELNFNDSKIFLEKYHIQGGDNSPIRYGAWLDGELVGVMTFKKKKTDGEFELNRYATNFNYHIRGLGSKMLKRFERDFSPSKITTFADIRWTPDGNNNLYIRLGFTLVEQQPPVYHYYNPKLGVKRFNRINFQKHKILAANPQFTPDMTEKEMMVKLGYDRVWDCGNWKFEKLYK